MRIGYVIRANELGGADFNALALARARREIGETAVFFCNRDHPLRDRIRSAGFECRELDFDRIRLRRPWHYARAAWTLGRLFHQRRLDLVYFKMGAGLLAELACRAAGTPGVAYLDSRDYDHWVEQLYLKYLVRDILCASHAVRRRVIAQTGAAASKVGVIENGIAVDRLKPACQEALRADFRRQAHIPKDGFVVAMISRIDYWKGQEVFIRAFAKVCADYPKLYGLVVGSESPTAPGWAGRLQRLADDLGLASRLRFIPWVEDVRAAFAASDVLVNASNFEPYGTNIQEAMAAGRAVIATDSGGSPEMVVHRATGLIVPTGDVEQMAAAIARLAGDTAEARRFGEAGRARAVAEFTLARFAARMGDHYRALVESGRAGR